MSLVICLHDLHQDKNLLQGQYNLRNGSYAEHDTTGVPLLPVNS